LKNIPLILNNGYPKKLIFKRIRTLTNKCLNNNNTTKDYEHKVCIPYVRHISTKIENTFKKYNSRICYSRLKNDIYHDLYEGSSNFFHSRSTLSLTIILAELLIIKIIISYYNLKDNIVLFHYIFNIWLTFWKTIAVFNTNEHFCQNILLSFNKMVSN
jgi:hypothetical protein